MGKVPFHQDDEFVASEARHGVARTDRGFYAARELLQDRIAGGVTMAVVDALEAIQIEIEQRQLDALALAADAGLRQAIVQQVAVGQSRQLVVLRHARETFLELLLPRDVETHHVHAVDHVDVSVPVVGQIGNAIRAWAVRPFVDMLEAHGQAAERLLELGPGTLIGSLAANFLHGLPKQLLGLESEEILVRRIGEPVAVLAIDVRNECRHVIGDQAQPLLAVRERQRPVVQRLRHRIQAPGKRAGLGAGRHAAAVVELSSGQDRRIVGELTQWLGDALADQPRDDESEDERDAPHQQILRQLPAQGRQRRVGGYADIDEPRNRTSRREAAETRDRDAVHAAL